MSSYVLSNHPSTTEGSTIQDTGDLLDAPPLVARADCLRDEVRNSEDALYPPLSSPESFAHTSADASNRDPDVAEGDNAPYSINSSDTGVTSSFSASISPNSFTSSEDLSDIHEDETNNEGYDADDEASDPDTPSPTVIVNAEFPILWFEDDWFGLPLYLFLDLFPQPPMQGIIFTDSAPADRHHAHLIDHPELLEDPENPLPAQDNEELQVQANVSFNRDSS